MATRYMQAGNAINNETALNEDEMNLDRSNLAVRYYIFLLRLAGNDHLWIEHRLRSVKDLCQFVRAIIFRTISLVGVVGFFLVAISVLAYAAFSDPLKLAGILATIFGVFSIPIMVAYIVKSYRDRHKGKPDGVMMTYVKAVKRGICPLLTIVRD